MSYLRKVFAKGNVTKTSGSMLLQQWDLPQKRYTPCFFLLTLKMVGVNDQLGYQLYAAYTSCLYALCLP